MPESPQQKFNYLTDAQLEQRDRKNIAKGVFLAQSALLEVEMELCPFEAVRAQLKRAMLNRFRMAMHKLCDWGVL